MDKKPRLSSRAPMPIGVDDFIEAAEKPEQPSPTPQPEKIEPKDSPEPLPWEADTVREDVIKSVNLRLSEPYILKLQFLSERTNKSQQRIIREALFPALDQEVEKVLKEQQ